MAGINKVVQRQQEQQRVAEQIPATPSTSTAGLSMYDQSEFNRMIDEAMNRKDAPVVKTIEDRRQERKQPLQPKPTDENVQKEEEVTTQKKKPFDKDENLGDSKMKMFRKGRRSQRRRKRRNRSTKRIRKTRSKTKRRQTRRPPKEKVPVREGVWWSRKQSDFG